MLSPQLQCCVGLSRKAHPAGPPHPSGEQLPWEERESPPKEVSVSTPQNRDWGRIWKRILADVSKPRVPRGAQPGLRRQALSPTPRARLRAGGRHPDGRLYVDGGHRGRGHKPRSSWAPGARQVGRTLPRASRGTVALDFGLLASRTVTWGVSVVGSPPPPACGRSGPCCPGKPVQTQSRQRNPGSIAHLPGPETAPLGTEGTVEQPLMAQRGQDPSRPRALVRVHMWPREVGPSWR